MLVRKRRKKRKRNKRWRLGFVCGTAARARKGLEARRKVLKRRGGSDKRKGGRSCQRQQKDGRRVGCSKRKEESWQQQEEERGWAATKVVEGIRVLEGRERAGGSKRKEKS